MPGQFDRHARLDVTLAVFQCHQCRQLVGRIEVLDIGRGLVLQERRQAVDDFPLVLLVLDRAVEGFFPFRWHIPARVSHVTPHQSSNSGL